MTKPEILKDIRGNKYKLFPKNGLYYSDRWFGYTDEKLFPLEMKTTGLLKANRAIFKVRFNAYLKQNAVPMDKYIDWNELNN